MMSSSSKLFAGAMIVGPVLLLGSAVAFAAGGGLNEDELGGALLVYAFALFVVALWPLGITWLRQPRTSESESGEASARLAQRFA
jgi:hypothetical protein